MNELKLNDSWADLVNLFIANLDRKDTTKIAYQKALKEWIRFYQLEKKDANIHLILQYKQYLVEKKLSAYTISLYLTALKVFFGYQHLRTNDSIAVEYVLI